VPRFAFKHGERRGWLADGLRLVRMPDTTWMVEVEADEYDIGCDVDADLLGGELAAAFVISLSLEDHGNVDQALAFVRESTKPSGGDVDSARLRRARCTRAPDYYRTLLRRAASVSAARVHALIQNELDPRREPVIALGDRDHLGRGFAGARLTGARIIDERSEPWGVQTAQPAGRGAAPFYRAREPLTSRYRTTYNHAAVGVAG
jgi:hypothetical protein